MLVGSGGSAVRVGRRLAAGGQGEVFDVSEPPGCVLKRFLPAVVAGDSSLTERLAVMVANRPSVWKEARSGHVMLAWPSEAVCEDGEFVGFLMPRLDVSQTVELHQVANPSDRRRAAGTAGWTQGFSWKYLVTTAANLATVVDGLHEADVVVGDFNERNVLVWSDARVTLLDCDSMQVTDPVSQKRFLCPVGRPEFTAPELLGADWSTTVRAPSSDLFPLAIHIHQLLLEGAHPFDGVWHQSGDKPRRQNLAREGLWVHAGDTRLRPRPFAMGLALLPPELVEFFRRAFVAGATNPRFRPTALEWHRALTKVASQLATCGRVPAHQYPFGHSTCPWCALAGGQRTQATLSRAQPAAASPTPTPAPTIALATPVAPVKQTVSPTYTTRPGPSLRRRSRRTAVSIAATTLIVVTIAYLLVGHRLHNLDAKVTDATAPTFSNPTLTTVPPTTARLSASPSTTAPTSATEPTAAPQAIPSTPTTAAPTTAAPTTAGISNTTSQGAGQVAQSPVVVDLTSPVFNGYQTSLPKMFLNKQASVPFESYATGIGGISLTAPKCSGDYIIWNLTGLPKGSKYNAWVFVPNISGLTTSAIYFTSQGPNVVVNQAANVGQWVYIGVAVADENSAGTYGVAVSLGTSNYPSTCTDANTAVGFNAARFEPA